MQLVWFRSDLRTEDHPALYHAALTARQLGQPVTGIYIFTPQQWQQHGQGTARSWLLFLRVQQLQYELEQLGIPLLVATCPDFNTSLPLIGQLCLQLNVQQLHFNAEYEWNERIRDKRLVQRLENHAVSVQRYHDQCLVPPGQLKTAGQNYYRVFSPFQRAHMQLLCRQPLTCLPAPRPQAWPQLPEIQGFSARFNTSALLPFKLTDCATELLQQQWPQTAHAARQALAQFVHNQATDYVQQRDRIDMAGTSGLSAWLANGTLSVRQCLKMLMLASEHAGDFLSPGLLSAGALKWLGELCWRDFYRHVAVGYAHVCRQQAFLNTLDRAVTWGTDTDLLTCWQQGQTGIPLVDAAMRCLNATHNMHNRLRMICAMFLSKNLLLDWRLGEAWFARQLADWDFCSNNGGWQWSASVGTDAAPYFRIMNPFSQAVQHDPDARFIRQWLPELAHLSARQIHQWDKIADPLLADYPLPMVDVKATRQRAIDVFRAASASGG